MWAREAARKKRGEGNVSGAQRGGSRGGSRLAAVAFRWPAGRISTPADHCRTNRLNPPTNRRAPQVAAPWWIKAPFWALCVVLDVFYANRPIQRFWVLETVARIPYFSAISLLHLYGEGHGSWVMAAAGRLPPCYCSCRASSHPPLHPNRHPNRPPRPNPPESLGFWRAGAELRRIHFAEEWNELHHLQIMEALGGDLLWFDRFVAEHAALLYYWVCIGFYMAAPKHAYQFSELVEWHAVDTYAQVRGGGGEPEGGGVGRFPKGQDVLRALHSQHLSKPPCPSHPPPPPQVL